VTAGVAIFSRSAAIGAVIAGDHCVSRLSPQHLVRRSAGHFPSVEHEPICTTSLEMTGGVATGPDPATSGRAWQALTRVLVDSMSDKDQQRRNHPIAVTGPVR
jgi:hypothetical protein